MIVLRKIATISIVLFICGRQALIPLATAQTASSAAETNAGQSTPTPPKKKHKTHAKTTPLPPILPLHAREFVVARGVELWRGNYEFTNIGVNIPDLFLRFLNNNDASAIIAMKDAAKAGVRFVRCDGCTRSPQDFHRFTSNSASWLASFQRMLTAADDLGIGIIPVLLPDIRMIPAYLFANASGQPGNSIGAYLTQDSAANRLALQYIDEVVGRFKSDPRVIFWEVGDEYNLEADLPENNGARGEAECFSSDQVRSFMIQIAAHIKAIDKNHLVSSGNTDMRPNSWHLRQQMLAHRSAPDKWAYAVEASESSEYTDQFAQYAEMVTFFSPPGIDIVSVHQAPPGNSHVSWLVEDADHALRLPWTQQAAGGVPSDKAGAPSGKPIFIGEFGETYLSGGKALPIVWTLDFFRRIRGGPSSLCALDLWESSETDPHSASIAHTPELANQLSAANLALLTADVAAPYNK